MGYAAALLAARRPDVSLVLLAPTIGAAVTVLPTMFLNYIGFPIRSVGPPLALILFACSAVVITRFPRPTLPRWCIFVGIALLGALLLNAWPMFVFGVNWMSYMNTDMQLYVHTATNIYRTGFLAPPVAHAYIQQRAISSPYYIRAVLLNRRVGAENLLAFLMSLLGRDGYQSYMPFIVAMNLALISAATALVYDERRGGHVPVATSFLLACSPLMTLGVDSQLLPQVIGLALLIASLLILCRPAPTRPTRNFLAMASLSGVVLAALAAVYPESLPFLALAVVFFYVFAITKKKLTFKAAFSWIGSTAAVAAVSLNFHISTMLQMLVLTLGFGNGAGQSRAFTAYLIPSGLADLFGFSAVTWTGGNALNIAVIAGAALLAVTLVAMVALLFRGRVVAFGLLAMAIAVPLLFAHQNGFGLYKLAMYMQPFLLPTLLSWWGDIAPVTSAVTVVRS